MPARMASTTGLRPTIHSGLSPSRPPCPPPPDERGRRALAAAAFLANLYFLWLGRSSARGVGPFPSRPWRTRPPDPAVGLPAARLRTAPRLLLLPGTVKTPKT